MLDIFLQLQFNIQFLMTHAIRPVRNTNLTFNSLQEQDHNLHNNYHDYQDNHHHNHSHNTSVSLKFSGGMLNFQLLKQ